MRASVRRIRDLKIILKDLERHVKAPDFLRKGRPFRNFGLLPRELLANLMICAAGNFEEGDERLTVCTDPLGGDGLIFNQKDGRYMSTEHVFIPMPKRGEAEGVEDEVISAIEHKNKKGPRYAAGKDLVVFSEAVGWWVPDRAARRIVGAHGFDSVWVVHLEKRGDDVYSYCVSWLDVSKGDHAPAWRVVIDSDFKGWKVARIQ